MERFRADACNEPAATDASADDGSGHVQGRGGAVEKQPKQQREGAAA